MVIWQTCWGELLLCGEHPESLVQAGCRPLCCLQVVAYCAATESMKGGGWAVLLSSPLQAHPSLQGL